MHPEALLDSMSPYELLDLYYTTRDSIVLVVTTLMSAMFAYIAVAHFAARQFTRFEILSISLMYSVFALFLLTGLVPSMFSLVELAQLVFRGDGGLARVVAFAFPAFLTVCWLLSLVFMHRARSE